MPLWRIARITCPFHLHCPLSSGRVLIMLPTLLLLLLPPLLPPLLPALLPLLPLLLPSLLLQLGCYTIVRLTVALFSALLQW
jgi:hypothetical protein